jgi:hypothetical protein
VKPSPLLFIALLGGWMAATLAPATRAATQLSLDEVHGAPGSKVEIPIRLTSDTAIGAAQFDLQFQTDRVKFEGAAAAGSLYAVRSTPLGAGRWRVVLYSLSSKRLTNGVLARLAASIPADAPTGPSAVALSNAELASDLAAPIAGVQLVSGQVIIGSEAPPRFTATRLLSAGQIQVVLSAASGRSYVLQSSSNLRDWSNLSTNVAVAGAVTLNLNAANQHQFYRAVVGR